MAHYFKIQIVILSFLGFVLGGNGFSQDSVYVLKIKKPTSILDVSHKDTFLVKGKHYLVSIKMKEGKKRVVKAKSDSIYISRVRQDLYSIKIARNSKINKGMIRVHIKNEDGTIELGEVLIYNIVEPPMPEIYVGNIKADSLIDKRYLYDYAKLNAVCEGRQVRLLSFDLVTFTNGSKNQFHSSNNKLTIPMKNHIQRLNVGSMIYFNNIKCLMADGRVEKIETIRLFFDETNKYKIGERIINSGN
ncbi:MAG: hypothetical protein ABF242_03885 [Flavobacteriales bacterium]